MNQLDNLITDLTRGRIDRRQFMQGAAALGLSASSLQMLGRANVLAQGEDGTVIWVSPRGLLEVFDDYPYWVSQHFGWFEGVETEIEGGPGAGAERLVAEGQADMAFPSPGVFTLNLEEEVPIVSVFQMGAYDVFDFAFRQGEGTDDLSTLEGGTIIIGDASWEAICAPMFAAAGADHTTIEYVSAGVTAWGAALQQGQGDAALSWEGKRAEWDAAGLAFDYWLGLEHSSFPANSFVIRSSDFEDESTHELYENYLRGWAMGLEFGHQNPRAAAQITYNTPDISGIQTSFPEDTIPDAIRSLWQLANVFRGDWPNRNGGQWGYHAPESWDIWFETVKDIGQLTREDVTTEDVIKNDFVDAANDFDVEVVTQAASEFELDDLFGAVPEPEGAGSDGAYPIPE